MDPLLIAIICFVLAAALASADLFVPSGGGLIIAALLAGAASIYFAFKSSNAAGMTMMVVLLVAIPVFLTVALRIWPHTPIARRMILKIPEAKTTVTTTSNEQLQSLVGRVGVTKSSLMPCGFVRIGRKTYSAVCESGVIDSDQNVVVLAIQQRNLVVAITHLSPNEAEEAPSKSEAASTGTTPHTKSQPENLLDRPAEELGLDSLE